MLSLLFLISTVARAKDVVVVQAGQQFLSADAEPRAEQIRTTPSVGRAQVLKTLKVKVGEQIVFKNLDKVTHNVYGQDFDLHAQETGHNVTQKFDKPGHQTVKCAIHPKMKFELDIEP